MLLAAIVSRSDTQSDEAITGKRGVSLSNVVPRLWPFLRHNILSVRKATLQTLKIILETYRKRLDKVRMAYLTFNVIRCLKTAFNRGSFAQKVAQFYNSRYTVGNEIYLSYGYFECNYKVLS